MEHTLDAYEAAIVEWNNCRTNSETLLNLISSGSCFEISRAMYNSWTADSPEYIHAYLGIDLPSSPSLCFMLIDSVKDSNPSSVTAENISFAPYLDGFDELKLIPHFSDAENPNNDISVLAGLERSFRWILNRKKYIENKVEEGGGENAGMFQVFHIPLGDLDSIFDDPNADKALVIIGLKEDNTTAELILWDENFNVHQTVEDVALPCPPFGQGGYSLMQLALNP